MRHITATGYKIIAGAIKDYIKHYSKEDYFKNDRLIQTLSGHFLENNQKFNANKFYKEITS